MSQPHQVGPRRTNPPPENKSNLQFHPFQSISSYLELAILANHAGGGGATFNVSRVLDGGQPGSDGSFLIRVQLEYPDLVRHDAAGLRVPTFLVASFALVDCPGHPGGLAARNKKTPVFFLVVDKINVDFVTHLDCIFQCVAVSEFKPINTDNIPGKVDKCIILQLSA